MPVVKRRAKNPIVIDANVAQFVSELGDMSGYMGGLAAAVFALSNEKDGGAFTRTMAKSFKAEVLRAVKTQGKSISVEWAPFEVKYRKWRERWWGPATHWKLSGTTVRSLIVTKDSGGWVARLDKRARTPKFVRTKGGGWRRGKSVPSELVASGLEHGTSVMPGRPLFQPVTMKVLSEEYPSSVRIIKGALAAATKQFAPKKSRGGASSESVGALEIADSITRIEDIDKTIVELFREGGFSAISQYSLTQDERKVLEEWEKETLRKLNIVVGSDAEAKEAEEWLKQNLDKLS